MPMITKKQSFEPNNAAVLALLFIFTFFAGAAMPKAALAFVPQTLVSKATDDDFDRIFREGKDLVDKEEWAKAAEKFSEAVNKYPKNKSADAALYWLAFSYKQQKAYKQAGETLDRLLKEFPASPWVADARVMKMEIAPAGITNRRAPTTDVQRALETVETATTYSNAKLAREDEIRLAAFQSLLSADAGRAVEAVGGLLRADSKASETLKKEALRSVTKARFLKESRLGQSMPELRETLISGFQNESNIKI